ncbi:MAG: hypothetical protein KC503_02605 [Myxococcales bacterium]|nr:hypothetical protein [Myxococcales bacterium]
MLVIDHNESERAVPAGEAVQISARIRSQLSNISARLFFRATGDKKFHLAPMQRVEGPRFAARVPTFAVVPPALEYYIEANAGSARTTKGSASSPLHLPVVGQEIADPGSGKPPWYKRWYVWVSLGIVVAGVTAAIIVATNQPDPNTQLP